MPGFTPDNRSWGCPSSVHTAQQGAGQRESRPRSRKPAVARGQFCKRCLCQQDSCRSPAQSNARCHSKARRRCQASPRTRAAMGTRLLWLHEDDRQGLRERHWFVCSSSGRSHHTTGSAFVFLHTAAPTVSAEEGRLWPTNKRQGQCDFSSDGRGPWEFLFVRAPSQAQSRVFRMTEPYLALRRRLAPTAHHHLGAQHAMLTSAQQQDPL